MPELWQGLMQPGADQPTLGERLLALQEAKSRGDVRGAAEISRAIEQARGIPPLTGAYRDKPIPLPIDPRERKP